MDKYLINEDTLMLVPDYNRTKIIEKDITYLVNKRIFDILDESCKFYGSSYKGRVAGSNYLLGITYKTPIIVSEFKEIIMFPTSSQHDFGCIWINYNHVDNFYTEKNKVYIKFKTGEKMSLDVSNRVVNNQILKSSRLESILKSKKR